MSEETLTGSSPQPETLSVGTTQEGQPIQSSDSNNQPNDPSSFQADYTKKYQSLSAERQSFEAERQQFYQQRAQQSYAQPAQGYTTVQQPTNSRTSNDQALIDQFGYEGAQAILQREQALTSQFQQTQFQVLYNLEEQKARAKFGDEGWNKHNYIDPATGQLKNKVMDLRLAINPLTGQSLTLEQAWNAVNPSDPKTIEQQIRDQVYAEMQKKASSMPAAASTSVPNASGTGHATDVRSAFRQALAEVGSN